MMLEKVISRAGRFARAGTLGAFTLFFSGCVSPDGTTIIGYNPQAFDRTMHKVSRIGHDAATIFLGDGKYVERNFPEFKEYREGNSSQNRNLQRPLTKEEIEARKKYEEEKAKQADTERFHRELLKEIEPAGRQKEIPYGRAYLMHPELGKILIFSNSSELFSEYNDPDKNASAIEKTKNQNEYGTNRTVVVCIVSDKIEKIGLEIMNSRNKVLTNLVNPSGDYGFGFEFRPRFLDPDIYTVTGFFLNPKNDRKREDLGAFKFLVLPESR